MKYNFTEIEKKWQKYWEENKTFKAEIDHSKPKYYVLDFFPYPSSEGLHVGHPEGYTATDILARYKRMKGFNVLHPMGWDAFGLSAEQYAVRTGVHPRITTQKSIANFTRQLKMLGFSYDWDREIATIDSKYYKWTQWIFLQLYKMGLAYQAEVAVNWSPELGTVLANEEVPEQIEKGFTVERRPMKQWMLKITEYAERLLVDLDMLDWPESTKEMQRNWIGKSDGAKVKFTIKKSTDPNEPEEANETNSDNPFEILWNHLKNNKLGYAITRQDIIENYEVDFVSTSKRLIIEIGEKENEDKDKLKALNDIGYSVIGFTTDDILNKTDEVLIKIKKELDKKIIDYKEDVNKESVLELVDTGVLELEIFTTRPDTLWGATYMVLAPEHPFVDMITTEEKKDEVEIYRSSVKNKSDLERQQEKEKTGAFTGAYAVNPVNNKEIPVWISDYVMMSYGTGAIMAVPGHDERDLEFAKKFELPIIEVVKPAGNAVTDISKEPFSGEGIAINSGFINGLKTDKAKRKVIEWLEKNGLGAGSVQYKLRDWLFSRQRFWGEPFPLIHLEDGTVKTVPEEDLPVALPEVESYKPTGTGESPLASFPEWVNTIDKETGKPARRETNTMPQWAGSCWYYLRFLDPENENEFCSKEKEKYWMPVNLYLGGSEHTVLHLLYARFWHKVLFDLGLVSTREPFVRLYHQGMILGEDSNKMSKSRGNVVNPDDVVAGYGADSLRLFEMFLGPLSATKPWSTKGIEGVYRFLNKLWRLIIDENGNINSAIQNVQPDNETEILMHRTIKKVSDDIEDTDLKFNTSISEMMIYLNEISKLEIIPGIIIETIVKLLAPFAPHIAEELWQRLGNTGTISFVKWPEYNPAKIVKNIVTVVVQINGKVRGKFDVENNLDDEKLKEIVKQDTKIKGYIDGKEIVKEIVVKNKLVNIVIK